MDAFSGTGYRRMTLKPCATLRTLGYRVTGVQRYLLGLLPYMPSELETLEPPRRSLSLGGLWSGNLAYTSARRIINEQPSTSIIVKPTWRGPVLWGN